MPCLQVYVLKEEEGGRHTPFMTNYCPQLYTRTADVGASMLLPSGIVFVFLLTKFLVLFPDLNVRSHEERVWWLVSVFFGCFDSSC